MAKLAVLLSFCLFFVVVSSLRISPRDIVKRGWLNCGVSTDNGAWITSSNTGFDPTVCSAVAYAIIGNWTAYKLVRVNSVDRWTALVNGSIDILIRQTTITQGRASGTTISVPGGVRFSVPYMYESQNFLVTSAQSDDPSEFQGTLCTVEGSTTTDNGQAYLADASGVKFVTYSSQTEITTALEDGDCDGTVAEQIPLAVALETLGSGFKILSDYPISREPYGISVHVSQRLLNVVNNVLTVMILADQYGITSANVEDWEAASPEEERLLAYFPPSKKSTIGWNIILNVGNYGELYDAYLEEYIARVGSRQEQWVDGGLLYAYPWV